LRFFGFFAQGQRTGFIHKKLFISVSEVMETEQGKKDRRETLRKLFDDIDQKEIVLPMIDDVVFLEEKLTELRRMPFIRVHPDYPDIQKATQAAKQYKELLQQYNNCIKILSGILRKDEGEEESPLRTYLKGLRDAGT
jgi:hypothetical protein